MKNADFVTNQIKTKTFKQSAGQSGAISMLIVQGIGKTGIFSLKLVWMDFFLIKWLLFSKH